MTWAGDEGVSVKYEGREAEFKRTTQLTDAEYAALPRPDGWEEPSELTDLAIDLSKRPDPTLPMPAALERSDGGLILYRQRTNWLSAASGAGKTWVAMLVVRYLLGAGVRVVWLDYDNGTGEDLTDRAPSLGIADLIQDQQRLRENVG